MVGISGQLPLSRLGSLYKDFRNMEDLNPEGYQANIDTWKTFLTQTYFKEDSVVFKCGSSFLYDLSVLPYGPPKSIDVVLDSLITDGYLIPLEDFIKGDADILIQDEGNTSNGGKSGFWNYIQWFSSKLSFTKKSITRDDKIKSNETSYLKELQFVIIPHLRKKYDSIYGVIRRNIFEEAVTITSIVYGKEEFIERSGIQREISQGNQEEIDIMLFYMDRYKNIIKHNNYIVKITDPSVLGNILKNLGQDITTNDERIVNLKNGIYNMEKQITKLRLELNQIRVKEDTLKDKDIVLSERAANRIKQTRQLTGKYLNQLIDGLTNLQKVKNHLDMCGNNQLVVDTLNDSNEVIKNINNYVGSVEKVEDLLNSISEESMKTEEINEALTTKNSGVVNFDKLNEEIEEELNQMEKTNKNVKENVAVEEDKAMETMLNKLNDLNVRNGDIEKQEKEKRKPQEKVLEMGHL